MTTPNPLDVAQEVTRVVAITSYFVRPDFTLSTQSGRVYVEGHSKKRMADLIVTTQRFLGERAANNSMPVEDVIQDCLEQQNIKNTLNTWIKINREKDAPHIPQATLMADKDKLARRLLNEIVPSLLALNAAHVTCKLDPRDVFYRRAVWFMQTAQNAQLDQLVHTGGNKNDLMNTRVTIKVDQRIPLPWSLQAPFSVVLLERAADYALKDSPAAFCRDVENALRSANRPYGAFAAIIPAAALPVGPK
jgi:hypothetical protein